MAKRKRLMPAQASYLEPESTSSGPTGGPLGISAAPIAQVASDASASAALEELSEVLANARAKGLMIEELPLDQIDESYLVRDRILQDEDDMQALMQSIRARGQQTPIEVVRLTGAQAGKRYGLISGWRRLAALRRLYQGNSESEHATVKALIVQPDSAEASYVAMVEENEIRVNLSHYERARIALKALEMGLYEDQRKAILGLFGNASRTKRSKIASFVALVQGLDAALKFPTAISEKLGLGLAQHLDGRPEFAAHLRDELNRSAPATAEEEVQILQSLLSNAGSTASLNATAEPQNTPDTVSPSAPGAANTSPTAPETVVPKASKRDPIVWEYNQAGFRLGFHASDQRIELVGEGVDERLLQELQGWLRHRR